MKESLAALMSMFLTGCTVFGIRTAEQANYTVLLEDGDIQIRQYEDFILVKEKGQLFSNDGENIRKETSKFYQMATFMSFI